MHKLNPRTAALLSAFGWAVGYLLAGKALAVLLPVPRTEVGELSPDEIRAMESQRGEGELGSSGK